MARASCPWRLNELPTESDLANVCDALGRQLAERLAPGDRMVVLSHCPALTELCPGHACLGRFLAQHRPAVWRQDHWRQPFGKQATLSWPDGAKTLVVNPGPRGGLVTIDTESGQAAFESV